MNLSLLFFCYIRNKIYKNNRILLKSIKYLNPELYAENDEEDIYFIITPEEMIVIERLKFEYENRNKS